MKNIHILSTDKPSRLYKCRLKGHFILDPMNDLEGCFEEGFDPQHIYITSDEEIKDGEYGLSKLNEIIKFHSGYDYRYYAKIILTTDYSLAPDVQKIDDEFLEWFVKNPSCESVEVYKSGGHYDGAMEFYIDVFYSITIPKEERKKNFYCGDEVDYGDQCSEQCVQCVNATGVDYGYLPHEDPKPFKHEVKSIPKEEIIGKRLEKYSERFDNDKSPIGNPETWGKRLVDETIEEAFDRINNSIDFTEFDFASFKLGVKWEQERNK